MLQAFQLPELCILSTGAVPFLFPAFPGALAHQSLQGWAARLVKTGYNGTQEVT